MPVRRIAAMPSILNLAAYKFVDFDDPEVLRDRVRAECRSRGLNGTVLLAAEGINLALAGDAARLRDFLAWLRADPRLADLACRESWSATAPFGRLRVRIKREIIRMDRPAVRPADERAPAVSAVTLARWLEAGYDDAGRAVATLDTRNAFEVEHGAFDGALDWRLARFGDFPAALDAHKAELEGKTVVPYCTGGIRCEKAAILMREAGIEHVLQLDGGILGYFEQTRSAPHWSGRCFVFDQRGAIGPGHEPAAG
jgi:UPF0176 protein